MKISTSIFCNVTAQLQCTVISFFLVNAVVMNGMVLRNKLFFYSILVCLSYRVELIKSECKSEDNIKTCP